MTESSEPPSPVDADDPGRGPSEAPTTSKRQRLATGSYGPLLAPADLYVVYSPEGVLVGQTVSVNEEPLFLGRVATGSGLAIADPEVSRLHARIHWDAEAKSHRIDDAGSTNGTFVNGVSIQSALLARGALIRVGDTLLLYDGPNPMPALREQIRRGASSELTVLLLGESGAGKEVLARAVHSASGRTGPFVAVNCGAFQPDLMAADLFGHTKGAFSGAAVARAGLFVQAAGGTLFLDEIGDLPMSLQPVLLRAIDEGRVRAVGADRETQVDVRLVCATNVDLVAAVDAGAFRRDVFARIAELVFHVPALRHRKTEVLPLLHEIGGLCPEQVTADAAEALMLWHWPTNVRGIRAIARAFRALCSPGETFGAEFVAAQLPEALRVLDGQISARDLEEQSPASAGPIPGALARQRGNVAAAAKELGISRMRIYRWLRQLGLSAERFR